MPGCLYIFLDESGNFDFSDKGTNHFVLTSIAAYRPFSVYRPLDDYKYDCLRRGLPTEYFHCVEDNQHVRQNIFQRIEQYLSDFRIDSLVVNKRKTGPALREDRRFYPEMLGYLLCHVIGRENKSSINGGSYCHYRHIAGTEKTSGHRKNDKRDVNQQIAVRLQISNLAP